MQISHTWEYNRNRNSFWLQNM